MNNYFFSRVRSKSIKIRRNRRRKVAKPCNFRWYRNNRKYLRKWSSLFKPWPNKWKMAKKNQISDFINLRNRSQKSTSGANSSAAVKCARFLEIHKIMMLKQFFVQYRHDFSLILGRVFSVFCCLKNLFFHSPFIYTTVTSNISWPSAAPTVFRSLAVPRLLICLFFRHSACQFSTRLLLFGT